MISMVCFWLLSISGLTLSGLTVEDIYWTDPTLTIFKIADYSHPRTVCNLAALLEAHNSRSVSIQTRYQQHFSTMPTRPFVEILKSIAELLTHNLISTGTARTLLHMRYWGKAQAMSKNMQLPGIRVLLTHVVALHGPLDDWIHNDRQFMSDLIRMAPDDADASLPPLRSKNSRIQLYSIGELAENVRPCFFLLDSTNIDRYDRAIQEDLINMAIAVPSNLDAAVEGLVYMIHFVLCISAHLIAEPRSCVVRLLHGEEIRKFIHGLILGYGTKRAANPSAEEAPAYRQIIKFLKVFLDMHSLCTLLAERPSSSLTQLESTWTLQRPLFAPIVQLSNPERLQLTPVARARMNFGLMALAFVERDAGRPFYYQDKATMRMLVQATFADPEAVPIKDLVMAVTVVSDYSQYYGDARTVLGWILKETNKLWKLASGVLGAPGIREVVKRCIEYRWRRRRFYNLMEHSGKQLLAPKQFLAQDPPEVHAPPFSTATHVRYYDMVASSSRSFYGTFEVEHARFTKVFLGSFIPWLLHKFFLESDGVYLRPNFKSRHESILGVLVNVLETAVMIDMPLDFRLSNFLLEHLQEAWVIFGSQTFTLTELAQLLKDGRPSTAHKSL